MNEACHAGRHKSHACTCACMVLVDLRFVPFPPPQSMFVSGRTKINFCDDPLGAGHTCMALLRHHQSCTTKVGISPDHHGYCAWRHWRHGGNLKSATTKKLVAKHKSGSATFAALSLLDLLDLGKISFSSLVMKWTADQEQLLLSLYFEVKTRHQKKMTRDVQRYKWIVDKLKEEDVVVAWKQVRDKIGRLKKTGSKKVKLHVQPRVRRSRLERTGAAAADDDDE
eukprot:scpid102769/ scgid24350/ 